MSTVYKFANFIATELEEGISAGALEMSIPLAISELLPTLTGDEEIRLVLWDGQQDPEIVAVTDNPQTGTLTIERAKESTTAVAWAAGTQVKCVLTAEIINAALEAFFDLDAVLESAFLPLAGGVLTGPLTLSGAPTAALHAASKLYVDSLLSGGFLALTGGTMSGAIAMAGNAITGLPSPSTTSAAATKGYVDSVAASSVKWKTPVRVATTADGTFSTAFDNGSTVDGVVLATGDRILIKNQADATQNGIYTVAASGAPTRATDADANDEVPGATVFVEEGTANAATQWTCTNTSVTLGSSDITFVLIAAGVTYTADETTLTLSGSQFAIKASGVGTSQITDDAVTFAKMQNITSDRLLGRDTVSSGNTEEISLTAPLAWSGSGSIGVDAATTGAAGKVELATAAETVTGTDTGRVPSVSVMKNHEGTCKAWAAVASDGTVEDSYGVTSVNKTGTGTYDITLSGTMANSSYAVLLTVADSDGSTARYSSRTTTVVTVRTQSSSGSQGDRGFSIAVFGTLA